MHHLDYKTPGPEDQRERLDRWENWLLIISLSMLMAGVVAMYIVFGMMGR